YYTDSQYVRAASNAECALIATAILQGHQLAAERGSGLAPMNVGQEGFDYIKITDSAASDTRVGNIGYLDRRYNQGNFEFEFRFGSLLMTGLAGTLPPFTTVGVAGGAGGTGFQSQINALIDYMNSIQANQLTIINALIAFNDRTEFTHLSVTERLKIPQGTDKFG
ncbi:hypothetical protein LCGC14_3041420, partial [marine sediment metagenome]